MRRYVGTRWPFGCTVVVELGDTKSFLNPRHDLRNHSPDGFEYGYDGSGPAQLALALLADATGDDQLAQDAYQDFKREVVANLEGESWLFHDVQIQEWARSWQFRKKPNQEV